MLRPSIRTPEIYLHILLAVSPYFLLDLLGQSYPVYEALLLISVMCSLSLIALLYVKRSFPYGKYSYLLAFIYWGLPFSLGSYYLLQAPESENVIALSVILLIWTSDTMAYFVGRRFGKTKLFESISPNKTREGSLGAGLSILVISALIALLQQQSVLGWVAMGTVVWIAGTYGDLVESKMKRVAMVKDSGRMLPGHGGFLDRFDSLVMVIPFLLLLVLFS